MLCVIAKLDPEATEKLRFLKTALSEKETQLPLLYGHITIASYMAGEEDAFVQECETLIRRMKPFNVTYRSVEVLEETSILVAAPEKAGGLLELHDRIASRFGPALDRWTAGASWIPHTTLLYDPEADLFRLRDSLRKTFVPFDTVIRKIEFSKVLENGFEIIGSVEL